MNLLSVSHSCKQVTGPYLEIIPSIFFFFEGFFLLKMSTGRISQLQQLSCKIFSNVYNPTCARTGNKILRQRLLGPTLTAYNPKQIVHFRDVQALYPQLGLIDLEEKERLDEIARRKRRGKGAPKKGMIRDRKWIY
jgi:hypothetical protein